MARSYDSRRFPSGPLYGPDGRLIMRGPRRKIVGRVTPGDDVEVSREIERLWEWHTRLQAQYSRLTSGTSGGGGPGGEFYGPGYYEIPEEFRDYVEFKSGCASISGPITVPNGTYSAFNGAVPVGNFLANVEAGWTLEFHWGAQGAGISGVQIAILKDSDSSGAASAGVTTAGEFGTIESWDGPPISGFNWDGSTWSGPTMTFDLSPGGGHSFAELSEPHTAYMAVRNSSGFSNGTWDAGQYCVNWVYREAVDSVIDAPTTPGTVDGQVLVWDSATGSWLPTDEIDANARVGIRVDSTGTPTERRTINFIPGSGIDVSTADDSGNEEVDVTIQTLGRLNGLLYGVPAVGTSRFLIVPRGPDDIVATFNLERLRVRTETPSSSGDVEGTLQTAAGGEAVPTWTDIDTFTLPDGEYEVDVALDHDVDSDDLLRVYFSSVGTDVDDYQALITGQREPS